MSTLAMLYVSCSCRMVHRDKEICKENGRARTRHNAMDALPPVLADRLCLFLHDICDASVLQKTCKRLRWAGLGPECKWQWRLSIAQSMGLYSSPLRDRILQPGTAIHTIYLVHPTMKHMLGLGNNLHTVNSLIIHYSWPLTKYD